MEHADLTLSPTDGEDLAAALAELRAAVQGRVTPPTRAEWEAHARRVGVSGGWLCVAPYVTAAQGPAPRSTVYVPADHPYDGVRGYLEGAYVATEAARGTTRFVPMLDGLPVRWPVIEGA